ncbi:MAG: [FeFe] hydrogenase H-cluster radical SAM maturase HydG [Erysipelotrichales bacterium]
MSTFIDKDYINNLIEETKNASAKEIDKILDKASLGKGLNHKEVAVLVNVEDKKQIERLHDISYNLKKKIYGDRIVLFAPLYLSDYCVNNCTYCGYRRDNDFIRTKLEMNQIREEVKALESLGHKRLALEFGEDKVNCDIDYVVEAIKTIYDSGDIRRVNVNVAATDTEDYIKLKEADIGTYILFQETYNEDRYNELHPQSLKGDYQRQLFAHHKAIEAGLDDVGGGVLYGLSDYRFDLIAQMIHNEELLRLYGVEFHTISVPRIRPAKGVDLSTYPNLIDDDTFVKIVSIIRVAAPLVGMILSTREDEDMRKKLIRQGISQISAQSKTTVGGYADNTHESQFETGDGRTLHETMQDLINEGNLPSYCTACYRMGRTGQEFHDSVETLKIAQMCHPNAILTTLEYILDSKDEAMYEQSYPFLLEQIDKISDEKIRKTIKEYFARIENGERDLYI